MKSKRWPQILPIQTCKVFHNSPYSVAIKGLKLFLYLLNLNLTMWYFLLRLDKLMFTIHVYLYSVSWGQPWPHSSDQRTHPAGIDDSQSISITLIHSFCLSHQDWVSFAIQQELSATIICWVKINTSCPTIFCKIYIPIASLEEFVPRILLSKSISIPV